jgi:3-phenylpropionate/cinnamic acid dioxygenase small subunit
MTSRKYLLLILPLIIFNSCDYKINKAESKVIVEDKWSGIPGDSNFNLADRMAIMDVMNAYSLYWDNSDLDNFFGLFSDDALQNMSKEKANERLEYFKTNSLQRRHLMANTHFLEQSDSTAYIKQYTLLTSTKNEKKFTPISTLVYDVWLIKVNGVWKISKRKIKLDGELDVHL